MLFEDIVKNKALFDNALIKFNPRFRSQIEIKVDDKTYYFMGQNQEYIEKILSEDKLKSISTLCNSVIKVLLYTSDKIFSIYS